MCFNAGTNLIYLISHWKKKNLCWAGLPLVLRWSGRVSSSHVHFFSDRTVRGGGEGEVEGEKDGGVEVGG